MELPWDILYFGGKCPVIKCLWNTMRCVCREAQRGCIAGKPIAADDTRLIVGTWDFKVQSWKVGSAVEIVFSMKVPKMIPSTAAFAETGKMF